MSSEFEAFNKRLSKLERRASLEKRSGTITDVDKDKGVRVDWGPGSDGKPLKSPWIKQSAHHGIIVEHKHFKLYLAAGEYTLQSGMNIFLFVTRRNQHGDRRLRVSAKPG